MFPKWPCPNCQGGELVAAKQPAYDQPTGDTAIYMDVPDREAEWIKRRVLIDFSCTHCRETMLLVGEATEIESEYFDKETGAEVKFCVESIYPKYLYPAIPLISVPINAPDTVHAALHQAAQLYWPSLSACANAVRKAVECLMTAQGFGPEDVNGKFRMLSRRIGAFTAEQPRFGRLLDAIRALGNAASHEIEPKNLDTLLLDTLEIVEYVIAEIYDPRAHRMEALAARVAKGARQR